MLWTVGQGVEAGFNLSWLYDKTKLSLNMKRSKAKSEGSLRFNKCQAAVPLGVRHSLKAECPAVT